MRRLLSFVALVWVSLAALPVLADAPCWRDTGCGFRSNFTALMQDIRVIGAEQRDAVIGRLHRHDWGTLTLPESFSMGFRAGAQTPFALTDTQRFDSLLNGALANGVSLRF